MINHKLENNRVTFFLDEVNPTPGAPWTRINSFAKTFVREKSKVDIVGIFSPKAIGSRGNKSFQGMDLLNLVFKVPLANPLVFLFNLMFSFVTSVLILIARRPKIAIVSFPGGDSNSGFLLACALLRIRFVVDYRDEWENQLIHSLALSISAKKFYAFYKKISIPLYSKGCFVSAVITPFVRDLSLSGVKRVMYVPNGASCSSFKPVKERVDKGKFTIVYSGSVGEYYRLDVVISALKILADKGLTSIRLEIVGRGTNESILATLHQYALSLGIPDAVMYLGNISNQKELSKIIAEANVGIVPYDDNILWKNALPAKFYEYCACGLPVIATTFKDSILGNLILDSEIGLISDPLNVEGLAIVIEKMFNEESFRLEAGKRAATLVKQRFDRDKISRQFYEEVSKAAE
jgi:glycosyltransferase involved in cell wall biosynthesis